MIIIYNVLFGWFWRICDRVNRCCVFVEYILYLIFLGILWFFILYELIKSWKLKKVEELKKLIWVYDRDKCDKKNNYYFNFFFIIKIKLNIYNWRKEKIRCLWCFCFFKVENFVRMDVFCKIVCCLVK